MSDTTKRVLISVSLAYLNGVAAVLMRHHWWYVVAAGAVFGLFLLRLWRDYP